MIDVIIWMIALISALLMLAGTVGYAIILLGGFDERPPEPEDDDEEEEGRWEQL